MATLSQSLSCAVKTICKETIGFRFDYPLELVPQAGPKNSLHYYLYSDALTWEAMRLDSKGIPQTWYRVTGTQYWPAYVAWYGLVNLGHHLRRRDQASLDIFLNQIDWLERQAVIREDGTAVWTMNFDYPVGPTLLRAPWVSAHAQGLVMSALVRGWRITGRLNLLDLLSRSAKLFELDADHDGIRVPVSGHVLYTEVPGGPPPGILDGFMTSLLGLYDLYTETGDLHVSKLFVDGIEGLKFMLPSWDYHRKWSWYGSHGYLSPPAYHCLNRLLLKVLGRLSNEPVLEDHALGWDHERLSRIERAEIFLAFLLTKNACRLRNKTWRRNPSLRLSGSPILSSAHSSVPSAGRLPIAGRDRPASWLPL